MVLLANFKKKVKKRDNNMYFEVLYQEKDQSDILTILSNKFQDKDWLMRLLTFELVEKSVLHRVETKATVFGQEVTGEGEINFNGNGATPPVYKIQPPLVAELYGTWIMPLTKEVQVKYLLQRLD